MSFVDILYTILIGPLQLVFEIIYTIANRFIGHPGLAIIVLSLIMNFLVLPLYKRADAMQEAARDIENKLHDGVAHIKKTFSGDERMMILQTYYRQNDYKPTSALNGSVSLFLEIPFFMAAYNFLSHLEVLQGVGLGPIADLGAPDALITIGRFSINVLPFIMTFVNIISSAIFLKGFPLKTKIQLYGMALFFLVFLYTSPSGLVFYWTLNNLFSLVKTLFYKLKNPRKVLNILFSIVGLVVLGIGIFVYDAPSLKREIFVIGLGLALQAPLVLSLLERKVQFNINRIPVQNDRKLFILGGIFLTILLGILIPSNLIAASPQEFIDGTYFYNPMWYIAYTLCITAGTFLVWMGVFYWLASSSGKVMFEKIVWILCGVTLVNYMFFGTDLGIISATLQYEMGMDFKAIEIIKNLVVVFFVSAILLFIINKWKQQLGGVILTASIAIAGMSVINVYQINGPVAEAEVMAQELKDDQPHFNLSKEGKNVVVIMLDRAMGESMPYIFNEKPELKEQFDGFTYYSNVISHGACTNFGAPGLYGGYEYTPIEMNKRDDKLLVEKHNEALKVMPVLFDQNGYDVTVFDPPYANYSWIPDLSIYDEYPNIQTYLAEGVFGDVSSKQNKIDSTRRNFFCFSLMKTMPLVVQETLYNKGNYNRAEVVSEELVYSTQTCPTKTTSEGIRAAFMTGYNLLGNLPNMATIQNNDTNTFFMMSTNITHEPMMLQEPEYVPSMKTDNTKYYSGDNLNRFTIDGKTLKMEDANHIVHYQSNMAAMLQLGKWFDYLRENDVYDNTRIILVSDHGARYMYQMEELCNMLDDGTLHPEFYFPLLLVKDFDSNGFTVSDTFMTNADVPTLATNDIIKNPTNPFTNNPITSESKETEVQYIINSHKWDTDENNGYTFIPSPWWTISENIWDESKWGRINDVVAVPEEAE